MMQGLALQISHNVIIGENRYKNRVLNAGLDWLIKYIIGVIESKKINYIAIGDDDSQTMPNATRLGNERFRKEFTDVRQDGKIAVFNTFFTKDEANFHWREAGLFLGGTEEKDSGILIARVRINEEKTDTKTMSIVWEFGISNA